MATELQIKKFQENPDCVELATIMVSTIYPKIILLLSKLGMNEIRLEKINGLKDVCITINEKIEFFNLEKDGKKENKKDIYTIDFADKSICPYFSKETNTITKEHESASEKYVVFCKAVMNAIAPLELRVMKISEELKIAQSFTVPLTRNVLTEKYHGKKNNK